MSTIDILNRPRKASFGHASYAAFRPSYPANLYNAVFSYHQGSRKLALDLGCGPGIASREMLHHFDHVIGSDPSAGMVKQAQQSVPAENQARIEFKQGSAESSPFAQQDSVDCVVAAQAAHWFDQTKLWPELKRIVRPKGTVALWGYKDHVFVDFPRASEILMSYAYDLDPDRLGSYWSQPGRSYLQDKLRIIRPPPEDWEDVQRIEYEPGVIGKHSGEGTMFMEKKVTVGECKEYIRTWSSYHGWQEKHPTEVARSKGGKGDVIDKMFDEIAQHDEPFRKEGEVVDIEWGSALVMARKI